MVHYSFPDIKIPNFKTVRLSIEQVKSLPDEKLLALLNGEGDTDGIVPLPLQQIITSELLRRNLERTSKPHWSTVPSFWLLVISVVLSFAAIVIAVIALPQVQQRAFPESQQQQKPAFRQSKPFTSAQLSPSSTEVSTTSKRKMH
jgi:hypothetical protein